MNSKGPGSPHPSPAHGGLLPQGHLQPLQAVLFDMDGTLVETEQYWGEAMCDLARELGGSMSPAARERTVGTSMRVAMGVLYADLGVRRDEVDLQGDVRWVEDRTAELMAAGGIDWRPGARALLAAVRDAGVATALVTTTPRRLAAPVLQRITGDLGGNPFDVTVCGDEAPARKPDPAPYLQAMAALGVEAGGCLVIEDSQVGIAAGLAAGATVLGVPSLQRMQPLPGLVVRHGLVGLTAGQLGDLLRVEAGGAGQ
ncbi:HAD family hydrolase [Modestobacter lapidis]|nr:HAD family phosphatase [Modestobacter lapidis]